MGLDMYLYAEFEAKPGSALFKAVEQNLTPEHRKSFDPEYSGNGMAYVSGWEWDKAPKFFYNALARECGLTPHNGSPHFDVGPKPGSDSYLVRPVLYYWRKANHIHHWFVQNVQDGRDECQPTELDADDLDTLIDLCQRVTVNHDLAPKLLPPQSGFFFGGTEIGDWYFEETEETAKDLKTRLDSIRETADRFVYRSSW